MVSDETMTRHATIRSQQRGIPRAAIELILCEGDRIVPAGESCERIELSRKAAGRLAGRGIDRDVLERSRGVVVVFSRRTGLVVTVEHAYRPFRRMHYSPRPDGVGGVHPAARSVG
jgi:hypothetical protein